MILKAQRQVTQNITFDVPSYFCRDYNGGTLRDKMVDVLLAGHGTRANGRDVRLDIFSDDADVVRGAINQLRDTYATVDKLLQVMLACDIILPSENFNLIEPDESVIEVSTLDRA